MSEYAAQSPERDRGSIFYDPNTERPDAPATMPRAIRPGEGRPGYDEGHRPDVWVVAF